MSNGYGDVYRMNLLRDRDNYQAYRGVCSYRGFSLSGCSTTGEVVMLRIKATPTMPEYFSLVSTSMRWGTTMYFLNDVFRPLCSTIMAGYENWYPFDMSCSVAMYINSGGFGLATARGSQTPLARNPKLAPGSTNVIGALIPLTGDLADVGASYLAAYEIALSEVTNTPGMPPIRLLVKDTITDPLMAMEKLEQMYTQGVQVVLGPESSAECDGLREYAADHGMLLLSSSSTAVPLAVPDDNLMRMAVDDSQQAKAIAQNIINDGITNLVVLTRSDMYGEGLRTFLLQEFATRGGHVFFTGYCPRVTEFLPEVVTQLNLIVSARAEAVGAKNIGVFLGVFDEGVQILQHAASFPNLAAARWYGAEGMAGNASLLTNSSARSFARQTQFVCTEPDEYTNVLYSVVSDAIQDKTGVEPRPYALHAYDAFWLAALGLRDTGSTGTVANMRAAIRADATKYAGASGPVYFNSADDRSNGLFQCVRVTSSNEWKGIFEVEPETPAIEAPTNLVINSFMARWHSSAGALQYYLDVSSSAGFEPANYVSHYSNLLLGAVYSHVVTGLSSGETYYYRVRAGNTAGMSSNSAILSATLPAYSIVTASASPGGRVAPSGPVIVYPGWSAVFTATASNYYEIAEIHTNGGVLEGVAGMTSYTHRWDEVTADGQFYAMFRPKTATNAVPLWWLAQYYSVTTNGNELALSDSDSDGQFAWQEYIAGTVPTNSTSCLRFKRLDEEDGRNLVLRWPSALDRLYTLLYSSNLTTGTWTSDPSFIDVPGTGNDLCYTSSLPQQMPCGLYRVEVRLNP
jgi:branched-chain amino acid transport system substrate-binding protein